MLFVLRIVDSRVFLLYFQCFLFLGSLYHVHQGDDYSEDNTSQPELGSPTSSLFQVHEAKELDLCEYSNVIENPVEEKGQSAENIKSLFTLFHIFVGNKGHDLLVLHQTLKQSK